MNSLLAEHMTLEQATTLMGVSERHTRRILAAYREGELPVGEVAENVVGWALVRSCAGALVTYQVFRHHSDSDDR